MKYFGVLVLLALVCFSSIACAPVNSTNSSHVQWNNKASSFLIKVYKHLVSTGGDLSRLVGAKQIVGVYATVKQPASSPNVVNVLCWLNGSSLPLNQSHLVQLHLSVKAKPGAQQGDCVMALHDIKSNTEILSKNIPCGTSSNHMLTVTTFAKKWITNPATNAGVSVRISAKDGNLPLSSLPFISNHPNVEPPSYILYL